VCVVISGNDPPAPAAPPLAPFEFPTAPPLDVTVDVSAGGAGAGAAGADDVGTDASGCDGVEGPLTQTVLPVFVDSGAVGADALLAGAFVTVASEAGEFAAFGAEEFPDGAAPEDVFPGDEFTLAGGLAAGGFPGVPDPDVAAGGVAGFVFFSREGL
jgi:hypothetical protein